VSIRAGSEGSPGGRQDQGVKSGVGREIDLKAKRTAVKGLAVLLAAVGFSLVHANAASAQIPTSLTLTPSFDQNPVGTSHTVTASVTCFSGFFFGPCPAGVRVDFFVTGANNTGGTRFTNPAGQAMFTYTGFFMGADTIRAVAGPATGPPATKLWVVGPSSVTLFPPNDTNVVGTLHTVTATVRDQFGNRVGPGVLVQFTVTGGGTPSPPGGVDFTDPNGEATFTFTNFTAVTNQITADVPGCCTSNPVTKRWIAGPPRSVTLSPLTDANPVETQHCVIATVRDQFGNPVPGVSVRFSVTGSVMTSGSAVTGPTGQAQFCYMGPALPGADVINAYADTNNNNVRDPLEPAAPPASKTWVLPVTTPGCEIKITNGGWIIAMNGDRASFGGNAKADEDGNVTGQEEYQDHGPATPFNLHGNVLVIVCNSATSATIFGEATIDGSGSHTYRIDVEDNGEPGKDEDRYRMRVNAYDSGNQLLRGGNVQIHQD
jgi:hypothetical protein